MKARYVRPLMLRNIRHADDEIEPCLGNDALLDLLGWLKRRGYDFVTPTPATHARVISRPGGQTARDLRDVFGWSKPFSRDLLDASLLKVLGDAGAITDAPNHLLKCRYRVSSLAGELFLHSAYPTDDQDSVFLGPDSYRFARFVTGEFKNCHERPGARLLDIGTGAGVGAIVAGKLCPHLRIVMTDINPRALELARLNARAADVPVALACGPDLEPVTGDLDVILANPPYIADPTGRDYRDGGEMYGGRVAYDMAMAALPRLAPGGRLLLYTGSAIVDGRDLLREALADLADREDCLMRYAELDPDVFGEELETPAYADVERISVVGAVISRLDNVNAGA